MSAVIALMIVFALAAVRGAGDEMGRAALAESAPWIARIIPRIAVYFIFFMSDDDERHDLLDEITSIVESVFENRDTISDRARGIFVVLYQSATLVNARRRLRRQSLDLRRRLAFESVVQPENRVAVALNGQWIDFSADGDITVLELPGYAERTLRRSGIGTLGEYMIRTDEEVMSLTGLDAEDIKDISKHLYYFLYWLGNPHDEMLSKTRWATDPAYRLAADDN
jgi:hypothetical protein